MNATVQQITIREEGPTSLVPAQSESSAIINMIERAARDPSVDVDKLRQLMEMRTQVEATAAARAFSNAMTAAQTDMRAVSADASNPQTKSRYASFFALDKALRPIYTRNGFSLSFDTEPAPENFVRVVCFVECAGHTRKYHIDIPADGKGAKGGDVMTKTHATGAAVTYGRRYLLKMIFNIAEGDDDDGNAAADTSECVTEKQVTELRDEIVERGVDLAKFLKWAKVERLEDIKTAYFDSCLRAIQRAG